MTLASHAEEEREGPGEERAQPRHRGWRRDSPWLLDSLRVVKVVNRSTRLLERRSGLVRLPAPAGLRAGVVEGPARCRRPTSSRRPGPWSGRQGTSTCPSGRLHPRSYPGRRRHSKVVPEPRDVGWHVRAGGLASILLDVVGEAAHEAAVGGEERVPALLTIVTSPTVLVVGHQADLSHTFPALERPYRPFCSSSRRCDRRCRGHGRVQLTGAPVDAGPGPRPLRTPTRSPSIATRGASQPDSTARSSTVTRASSRSVTTSCTTTSSPSVVLAWA